MAGSKLIKAVDRITQYLDRTPNSRVQAFNTSARAFLTTVREVAQAEYDARHPAPRVVEAEQEEAPVAPRRRRR